MLNIHLSSVHSQVLHRWNLLLPLGGGGKLDTLTHEVISAVVTHTSDIFEKALGPNPALCDLSALVVDPGALGQRLHFDTRFSDSEDDDDDGAHGHGLESQKRLVTAFVALSDVTDDMGLYIKDKAILLYPLDV